MKYAIIILAALIPAVCNGQRRKVAKKPKKEVVTAVENPLVTQMLEAVRQVVFVDSMVVDKSSFYSNIPLSAECGQMVLKGDAGQYTNEMGDRRMEAVADKGDTITHLAASDLVGGQWAAPVAVKGIGADEANHPYIMPDGSTLYYAQKGEKSIGGYDIFVTRYNAESGSFLKPENLGMPFASEANDYLYVIDETMQLGYFVTDRRQPAGKVCIYVFVPSTSMKVYPSEAYSKEQLRSLAAINSIADTWGSGNERKEALERLKQAKAAYTGTRGEGKSSMRKVTELDRMRAQAQRKKDALAGERERYSAASAEDKGKMRDKILNDEKELELLLLQIRQKEKETTSNYL